MILILDFFFSPDKYFEFHFFGHHHNAIKIGEDQITRMNRNPAALDGHIVSHHLAPALGIQRADAGIENRKIHLYDFNTVPHLAVTNASDDSFVF